MNQQGTSASASNNDLVWSVGNFSQAKVAANFISLFANRICIYSASVEQLYTNYTVQFVDTDSASIKIVPDPDNHYDTFQNIPVEALESSGLTIIPGELVGKKGLQLSIPLQEDERKKMRVVPLQLGLKAINKRRSGNRLFLPVVVKGDLRALREKVPVLHLHTIRLDKMKQLSEMERNGIRKVIQEKLSDWI
jgi:hypothetical protein